MRTDRSLAVLCLIVPQLALAQGAKAPAAAKPAAAPAAPAAAAAAPVASDPEVRALEERVTDLKEKIYRTKARLMNLQEMVIGGEVATGAQAVIVHRNEMGSSFHLESVRYSLDGSPVFTDSGGTLHQLEEVEVFSGRVAPGNHRVAVHLVYRGDGRGVFSYVDGYRFEVESAYSFNVEPGKTSTVQVIGYEKGGFTTAIEERPSVRYGLAVRADAPRPAGAGSR